MAISSPLLTTHPTITTATWTKVNTVSGKDRRRLIVLNEDSGNAFRFELCTATQAATLGANDGLPLSIAGAVGKGGMYEEDGDSLTTQDIYVYQASGGDLTTLAVKEGV